MDAILTIHTDGGARGNPGPAAVGVVVEHNGKLITQFGKKIGDATNNVAEYVAVIEALKYCKALAAIQYKQIVFFVDSNLIAQQLNGKFKVKNSKLRELLLQVKILEQEIKKDVIYTPIPREQNRRADLLVNMALDNEETIV